MWGIRLTTGSHVYAEGGFPVADLPHTYTVTVTIKDVGGKTTTATNTSIAVTDQQIGPAAGINVTAFAGFPTGLVPVATFTDPGNLTNTVPSDYSEINWESRYG